jgi:uncharacterized protein YaaQ
MKLVVAIVQDYDVDRLLRAVAVAGLRATRIASTGGYLRTGNTTVMLGVVDEAVGGCLEILQETCGVRVERPSEELQPDLPELYASGLAGMTVGGGVAFVVPVRRFERVAW